MSGFLYPRTIKITRPNSPSSFGAAGFEGDDPANESIVIASTKAGIQLDRVGETASSNLPTSSRMGRWRILIPAKKAKLGTINKNDIVTDDLGIRYQVFDNYWTPLGYQLMVEEVSL